MAQMIGRNLFRTMILILAAGLVIGIIYALSFISQGTTASGRGEFLGQGQGGGQPSTFPEGAEFQPSQESGQGQGYGFGGGRHGGQGEGRGGEDEFSLSRGLPELGKSLIVIAVLIVIVSLLQYLAKRRQRVSTAT